MVAGSETVRPYRGRRWKALYVATLVASIVAAPAAAKIKDSQITPTSAESLIVISAQSQTFSDQYLVFSREGQSSYGGRYTLRIKAGDPAPFVVKAVAPGTYRLNNFVQQRSWSSCFGNGTVAFTVQPGKVYYLGTPNTMLLLADLQQSVIAGGAMQLRGTSNFIEWNPKVKPEFVTGATKDLVSVRKFVTTTMPMTTAPVESLATVPTTFASSKGKKILQVCG